MVPSDAVAVEVGPTKPFAKQESPSKVVRPGGIRRLVCAQALSLLLLFCGVYFIALDASLIRACRLSPTNIVAEPAPDGTALIHVDSEPLYVSSLHRVRLHPEASCSLHRTGVNEELASLELVDMPTLEPGMNSRLSFTLRMRATDLTAAHRAALEGSLRVRCALDATVSLLGMLDLPLEVTLLRPLLPESSPARPGGARPWSIAEGRLRLDLSSPVPILSEEFRRAFLQLRPPADGTGEHKAWQVGSVDGR